MWRRNAIAVGVAALVGLATIGPIGSASASRIETLRAEARRIANEIASNGDRIAALGEAYDGAVYHLGVIHDQQHKASRQLAAATRSATALRARKAQVAALLYESAGADALGSTSSDSSSSSALDTASSSVYTQAVAANHNAVLAGYRRAQGDLRVKQHQLSVLEASARAERDRLAASRNQIEAANERERQLLGQVNGQLGALIKEEQQRQQAALAAAARARAAADAARRAASSSGSGSLQGPNTPLPPAPAPSAGVAAVIAYARAQIGKPYVWDTAGPNTFDCSGLTMMAWQQAGVYMPHFSGAQYSMFPKVAMTDLQPGDLVFKGPGGTEHVALYVGGGMQIAATHTGSYVLLQPVDYAGDIGAVRP